MPLLHERLQLPRVAALVLVERTLHRFVPDDKQVLEDTFLLRVDDAILSIPTHKGERRVCEWNHERHCLSQRRRLLKHFSPARVRRPSAAYCSGCCSAPPSSCRCVPGRQTSPHGHAWPEIARTTRASQLVVCATSAQSPESWSHHDARGCRPVPFVPRPAPDSVTGAAGGPQTEAEFAQKGTCCLWFWSMSGPRAVIMISTVAPSSQTFKLTVTRSPGKSPLSVHEMQ